MKSEDYKPFFLNNITEVTDNYYILNGFPQYEYNEDMYYEIHIESDTNLKIIKYYVDDYIYIDIISPNQLEIYYGEHYEESCSDGYIRYINYQYKVVEKTSKEEWKPKYLALKKEFDTLLDKKLPMYVSTRSKIADQYGVIYKDLISGKAELAFNQNDNAEMFLFNSLLGLFNNIYSLAYLRALAKVNKDLILWKDWEPQYLELETEFNNLLKINPEDYSIIKKNVIEIYTRTFKHMLPNLKNNYKNTDEQRYIMLFDSIIQLLDRTNH